MNNKILIFINDFPESLSGVEVSAFQRAEILNKYCDKEVFLISRKFNRGFDVLSSQYKKRFKLNSDVKCLNLYDSFLNFNSFAKSDSDIFKNFDKKVLISDLHERYYSSEKNYNAYAVYSEKNKSGKSRILNYVNYFFNGKKIKRNYFLPNGRLVLTQYLNENQECIRECYLDDFGITRIIIFYEKSKIKNIYLNDEDGILIAHFLSEADFMSWWLVNHVDVKDSIVLVDGGPHHIHYFKNLPYNVKIVSILHSNHIKFNQNVLTGDFYSNDRRKLLEDPESVNACVVLTEEQKNDIEVRIPRHCPLFFIPHPCPDKPLPVAFKSRNLDRVVIISRLENEKNIIDAIDIMKIVINRMPNKKLYIYGNGSQMKNINDYIVKLGLSGRVLLMGYTENIEKELNSACLFIMTSLYESFGLSILESLSHGVPVISYDFKYGPRALIRNGVNGFLVENRNVSAAAECIINYFSEITVIEELSNNSYLSVVDYYPNNIAKKWSELFEKI